MSRHLKRKLRDRAASLIQMLDLNAPDNVLALSMRMLIDTATAAFGEQLYREIGQRAVMNARQRHGLCQNCDTDIAVHMTHPPLCETCDAKQSAEADQMEQEANKYEPNEKMQRLLDEIMKEDSDEPEGGDL